LTADGTGETAVVQMTQRDHEMLEWLDNVGFADLQAIRWAMSGTAGRTDGEPVALRKAQRWMLRMHTIGLIRRGTPAFQSGAVMWSTERASGRTPNIYRQTARHELAVAHVSARYLSLGYEWKRDHLPPTCQGRVRPAANSKSAVRRRARTRNLSIMSSPSLIAVRDEIVR